MKNSASGIAQIDTALIVGITQNNSDTASATAYYGISTVQSEHQLIRDVKFYNFGGGGAAFTTCHLCTGYSTHDQDARTIKLDNVQIDDSV